MCIALVADPDLRERARCIRVIAGQTSLSALGAATWEEVDQAFEGAARIGLIFYSLALPGAPDDAVTQLLGRTGKLVVAVDDPGAAPPPAGTTRVTRPIAEETLILMARAAGSPSTQIRISFLPVDFLQMVCMSNESHVLVLSHQGSDLGVIEVRDGQVWTAFDGLGVGEGAFARLIGPQMRARVSPASGSTKERTIFKDLHELVLESLRSIDEGRVSRPPKMSSAQLDAFLSTPEQLAKKIGGLNHDARRLLMERNYDEAARVLVHLSELDPSSSLVRANLEQLRRLGYPR
ncbi:MAG TPA: DUF4388 domain-containing protein [Polyangiaceae bacterium]|nr:DUF4388 domain-containing protein [Polyangiaceae bacterium]